MSHGGSSRVVAWDAPSGVEGPHRFLPYPYPYPYQFPGTVGSQRRAQKEARFLDVDVDVDVDVNVVVNVNVDVDVDVDVIVPADALADLKATGYGCSPSAKACTLTKSTTAKPTARIGLVHPAALRVQRASCGR
jgi:hypothetical protein